MRRHPPAGQIDKTFVAQPLTVDVAENHLITLIGQVPDEDARKKAVTLAQDTVGVREVVDRLRTVPQRENEQAPAAGHAVVDFLQGKCEDPHKWFARTYPKFRTKRLLRFLFDHFQSDMLFNLMLGTKPMRMAASYVYFHRRGVLTPAASVTKATIASPQDTFENK